MSPSKPLVPMLAALGLLGTAGAARADDPILPVFLADVPAQFDALSLRPEGLAFGIANSPDPRLCKHYQGIVRVQGPDGTPYMFVTRSGNQPEGIGGVLSCPLEDDDPGNLLVVRLGSREKHGERLRSNRYFRDWPVSGIALDPMDPTTYFPPTPPPAEDVVVNFLSFDGDELPDYAHPGGMQILGDVLVVGVEGPYESGLPPAQLMFFDVSQPETPTLLSSFAEWDTNDDFSFGTIGLTAIRNVLGEGCWYVIVALGKSNKEMRFYRSLPTEADGSTDLRSPDLQWVETGRVGKDHIEGCLNIDFPPPWDPPFPPIPWPSGTGPGHQMMNFVRQGDLDGPLYMIGARNTTALPLGSDKMDLYRVHLTPFGEPEPCFIELVQSRHFTSYPFMGGGDSLNFAAASGVYTSPSGELIVYAAEYENDGPTEFFGDDRTVRFGEFRHEDMVRPGSPTLRPTVDVATEWTVDEGSTLELAASGHQALTQAWIELYEDDDAGASLPGIFDSDMWLSIDLRDRDADDFDNFVKLGFWNEAGSWRWFAPVGTTIRANDYEVVDPDDDPGPDTLFLHGTDVPEIETDLDDIGFDDDMGSVTFLDDVVAYYAATIGVRWDLDDDHVFESAGDAVPFDATFLDGPDETAVAVRAQHPDSGSALGTGEVVPLHLTVRNVAPTIASFGASDGLGNALGGVSVVLPGLPVSVAATFTDPGRPDTHTASLSWNDGTVDTAFDSFADSTGGVVGSLSRDHVYAAEGDYTVALLLTDDDGDAAPQATASVRIVSAEEALDILADALEDALGQIGDGPGSDALAAAVADLLGNAGGFAQNGALDKLALGKAGPAITHLIHALGELAAAEAATGLDLSAEKDLVGLVAEHLAVTALANAPMKPKTFKKPVNAQALVDEGHALLVADDHVGACELFRQAVNSL